MRCRRTGAGRCLLEEIVFGRVSLGEDCRRKRAEINCEITSPDYRLNTRAKHSLAGQSARGLRNQNVNFAASWTMRWPCLVVTVPNSGVLIMPVVPLKPRFRLLPLNDHSGWFRKL